MLNDWGSALGFHWAQQNSQRVQGIAYMESIVTPWCWDDFSDTTQAGIKVLRSPAGESLALDDNMFVKRMLPASVLRQLSEAEMAEYRRPFNEAGEARRPTLSWPRQIPVDGEPADVAKIVADYSHWLAHSNIPKLFISSDPGILKSNRAHQLCGAWPNQTRLSVKGLHFIQEDSPHEIGKAVAAFVSGLREKSLL